MGHYDPEERALLQAASEQTGVGHDPRAQALHRLWRASRYYSAYAGIGEMLKIEGFSHQTEIRQQRMAVLEFTRNTLDHLIEYELKFAYDELKRYFDAKQEPDDETSSRGTTNSPGEGSAQTDSQGPPEQGNC